MNKILSTHTSCQDCIFAQKDFENDEQNGISVVQTGCLLELLSEYGKTHDIIPAYNQNGSFYIVNGRLCYFKRNKEWANHHKDAPCLYEDLIREEQKVPYVTFILGNDYIEDYIVTLKSVDSQYYGPRLINLVLRSPSKVDKKELFNWMSPLKASWKVTYLSPDCDIDEFLDDYISLHYKKYPIYQIIEAGYCIKPSLMTKLNNKIIMEDFRFCRISTIGPNLNNVIIGNSTAHHLAPRSEFFQSTITDIEL
jgi:hypothetical protein